LLSVLHLISSTVVYNYCGSLQLYNLNQFNYLLRLGQLIGLEKPRSPDLILVLRDWKEV